MPLPNLIVACILAACAVAYAGVRLYWSGYQRALKDVREKLEDAPERPGQGRAPQRTPVRAFLLLIAFLLPSVALAQDREARSPEARQAELQMILSALEANPDSIMTMVANGWQPPMNGRIFLRHYRDKTGDLMHQAYPDSVFEFLLYPPKPKSVLECEAAYLMAADVFRRSAVFSAVDVLMEKARECAEGGSGRL